MTGLSAPFSDDWRLSAESATLREPCEATTFSTAAAAAAAAALGRFEGVAAGATVAFFCGFVETTAAAAATVVEWRVRFSNSRFSAPRMGRVVGGIGGGCVFAATSSGEGRGWRRRGGRVVEGRWWQSRAISGLLV